MFNDHFSGLWLSVERIDDKYLHCGNVAPPLISAKARTYVILNKHAIKIVNQYLLSSVAKSIKTWAVKTPYYAREFGCKM